MHIAIIGNGIAGITAARFIRKLSDHRITVISAESDYFFSRTALMYIYMGHMQQEDTKPYEDWFWVKNRIDLLRGYVYRIDTGKKLLHFDTNRSFDTALPAPEVLRYDKLIIACGSRFNKFGWPGQDLQGVNGMISLQDLDYMEQHSPGLQRAVIVGGGLIGIEMGEMFHSRHIPVTFLVREKHYWDNVLPEEEARMVNRHIVEHGFDLRLSTELKEIVGDEQGKARAVVTGGGDTIECGFVGLTAGVRPNIGWLKDTPIETGRGILVNEYLQTNLPDVYAAGDCAELRQPPSGRRPIEAVWYVGRMMGETVAYNICGHQTPYDPGIWFNSAKFLDIEYQVYGDVPPALPDAFDTLYWEHPAGKKSIRLNYEKASGILRGINLMGVRYRQEVCEAWIREETHIEKVLEQLSLANFDPEFYREYEKEVVLLYNRQTGRNVRLRSKRKLTSVVRFLKARSS